MSFDDLLKTGVTNETVEAIKDFFKADNIETKTDLRESDIKTLTLIKLFAYVIRESTGNDTTFLDLFCDLYCTYRISLKRKSRAEFIEAIKQRIQIEDAKKKGLSQKLF